MRVLIIEDELIAQQALVRVLTTHFQDIQICGVLDSVDKSVHWLTNSEAYPDVIFMDVELSDGKCFDIFEQIKIHCPVVIVTAYNNYAVKAFEVCVNAMEDSDEGVYMTEISGPTIPVPLVPKLGYQIVPLGKNWSYGIAALIFAAIEYKRCLEGR